MADHVTTAGFQLVAWHALECAHLFIIDKQKITIVSLFHFLVVDYETLKHCFLCAFDV